MHWWPVEGSPMEMFSEPERVGQKSILFNSQAEISLPPFSVRRTPGPWSL